MEMPRVAAREGAGTAPLLFALVVRWIPVQPQLPYGENYALSPEDEHSARSDGLGRLMWVEHAEVIGGDEERLEPERGPIPGESALPCEW